MPVLERQGCQSSWVSIAWQTKFEMPLSQQEEPRINLLVLRAQMVKRIGSERANRYFDHFKSFISSKFSKQELDRLVVLTIGKENIGLHNQIIKAVLTNAIKCSTPPPVAVKEVPEPIKGLGKKSGEPCGTATAILPASPATANALSWSNGKPFQAPLRKDGEPATPDRKANKDKSSMHGPLPIHGESVAGVDLHRPSQEAAGNAAEQSEGDPSRHNKRPRTMLSPLSQDTSAHDPKAGLYPLGDGYHCWDHGLIRTLFSSPFSPGSIRPASQIGLAGLYHQLLEKGGEKELVGVEELPDIETLHGRMGHLAALEGIEAVDSICAELLNRGVDTFIRRLIKSCMDAVRSRGADTHQRSPAAIPYKSAVPNFSTSKRLKDEHDASKAGQMDGLDAVGAQIANTLQESPTTNTKIRVPDGDKATPELVSLLDFKAAMELNPQQLGEDWPLRLEKISFRSLK